MYALEWQSDTRGICHTQKFVSAPAWKQVRSLDNLIYGVRGLTRNHRNDFSNRMVPIKDGNGRSGSGPGPSRRAGSKRYRELMTGYRGHDGTASPLLIISSLFRQDTAGYAKLYLLPYLGAITESVHHVCE